MNDVQPQRDPEPQDPQQEQSIEIGTPSGRAYKDQRWTLGNSTNLVEGEEKEPLLVTLAWIVLPSFLGLLAIWLMTR